MKTWHIVAGIAALLLLVGCLWMFNLKGSAQAELPRVHPAFGAASGRPVSAPPPPTPPPKPADVESYGIAPIGIHAGNDLAAEAASAGPAAQDDLPFGLVLRCQTDFSIESSAEGQPVIGHVTETLVDPTGRVIVPGGQIRTQVLGYSKRGHYRDHILCQEKWVIVRPDRRELVVRAVALDQEKAPGLPQWSLADGALGIKGDIIDVASGLKKTWHEIAGAKINDDSVFVRTPPGKDFYLFIEGQFSGQSPQYRAAVESDVPGMWAAGREEERRRGQEDALAAKGIPTTGSLASQPAAVQQSLQMPLPNPMQPSGAAGAQNSGPPPQMYKLGGN